MKIMMTIFAITILATNAFAGCIEDFKSLQNKKKVALVKVREVEIFSKNQLKKLRSAELKAVTDYIDYMSFGFDEENALYVATQRYESKDGFKSSLGYRISVTDGGDESNVRYYIKIDVDIEEVTYPILYRVLDNQTPDATFLCQKY